MLFLKETSVETINQLRNIWNNPREVTGAWTKMVAAEAARSGWILDVFCRVGRIF